MERWVNKILLGNAPDVLRELPDNSIHCCVTSPPYWGLRDYGVEGQLGLEKTPEEYVQKMVDLFREVRRVLRDDGTLWLNLGDSYATGTTASRQEGTLNLGNGTNEARKISRIGTPVGLKTKDLVGIPWRVAFALQADGWYLRSDIIEDVKIYCPCCGWQLEERIIRHSQDREIIWNKPNPMPESVTDRPTKAHEYIFLMSKNERYYYDHEAIKEPAVSTSLKKFTDNGTDKQRGHGRRHAGFNGRYAETLARDGVPKDRNRRSVWTVATHPFPEAHFATFPPDLIKPCILAGCPENGITLDPFMGAGTTGVVCADLGRNYIGIELNPEYVHIANERIKQATRQERLFL